MKNFIIQVTMIIACFGSEAQTNRTATTSVTGTFGGEMEMPLIVTNRFDKDHPNIAPTWSMEEDNYAAQYRDQTTNLTHITVYDRFGNLVRNDVEVEKPALPPGVCSYYSNYYPDEDYVLWKSVDANGKTTYYSKREENIICFDKNGKFITTKVNKNKEVKKGAQASEKE